MVNHNIGVVLMSHKNGSLMCIIPFSGKQIGGFQGTYSTNNQDSRAPSSPLPVTENIPAAQSNCPAESHGSPWSEHPEAWSMVEWGTYKKASLTTQTTSRKMRLKFCIQDPKSGQEDATDPWLVT